jgi:hypothetical protein
MYCASWQYIPTLALVSGLLLPASARADSLSSLPDPRYAHNTPLQPDPITSRITAVVYPTLGLPALVPYGGELDVFLVVAQGKAPVSLREWKALLRAREAQQAFPLTIVAVNRDRAITRLRVRVPARAPREIYDLEVTGPGLHDVQPNAVRIYGQPKRDFRFAVVADHQLWDPSWRVTAADRSAGDWPRHGESADNRAVVHQQLAELSLLDPEFVIHAGDLMFGLEYPKEYEDAWNLWKESHIATFMLPGNHDGYATYGVRLEGTPLRLVAAALACQAYLQPPYDWPRAFAALQCIYGDIKGHLFSNMRRDGLSYWRRTFGPPYYSWDYGDLHFVAINTYDGSAARRHSFALWVDAYDLHLGAPAVDNFGGFMSDEQLDWLATDLRGARSAGKTVVVIGHHDPRGNLTQPPEQRYQADLPFPTSPLGLGPFQEWNYDSEVWSSDGRGRVEKPDEHSGTKLLRLLAGYADYYIDGHAHHDEHRIYQPGEVVASGVVTRRPVDFLRVTTGASSPSEGDDYWGYRVIDVKDGRVLQTTPFSSAHALGSIPCGNLWREDLSLTAQSLVSGLPEKMQAVLRFHLPRRSAGWDFVGGEVLTVVPDSDGKAANWYVGVTMGPPQSGQFPTAPGKQARHRYEATPARAGKPPQLSLEIVQSQESPPSLVPVRGARAGRSTNVVLGQPTTIKVGAAHPDDPQLIATYISIPPDVEETRTSELDWTPSRLGRTEIRVEAMDAHGRSVKLRRNVTVVAASGSR